MRPCALLWVTLFRSLNTIIESILIQCFMTVMSNASRSQGAGRLPARDKRSRQTTCRCSKAVGIAMKNLPRNAACARAAAREAPPRPASLPARPDAEDDGRALAAFALRGRRGWPRSTWGSKPEQERVGDAGVTSREKSMERQKVEELKNRVPCAAVLEKAGFAVDPKESTRRAIKYRRDNDIIIVIHAGKGWFDPLSDAKGDVYGLVAHLNGGGFNTCLDRVAELVGFVPIEPAWPRLAERKDSDLLVTERWRRRCRPWRGSATWRYLRDVRHLSEAIIQATIRQDRLREGPWGSMWAAHTNDVNGVVGWEERGPEWRGFATGGAKVMFRLGGHDAVRICVAEAAIDAMSLATIEHLRPDTLFLSTGGGWAPSTEAAIRTLAAREGTLLVAATDNNPQGEVYAGRLMAIALEAGCGFERLRPLAGDWNEELSRNIIV